MQPEGAQGNNLVEVEPVYSVTFTFGNEAGDLRLTMIWRKADDAAGSPTGFDVESKQWTRLDRDTGSDVPLLDIALSDLNTGMAWQFDIQASQAMDEARLSKAFSEFRHSVTIDPNVVLEQSANR